MARRSARAHKPSPVDAFVRYVVDEVRRGESIRSTARSNSGLHL
jgi:hypothetical protein